MSLPLLSLRDAMVTFGGKPLFEGLTLTIAAGERICLVGRNGSGKSTLMKLITGDREPDGGERFVQPGTRFGYLPQQVTLNGERVIYDHVLRGLPAGENGEDSQKYLADQVLEPLGLTGSRDVEGLSGGQLRRMALARALVAAPDILLLDEPTNHLDIGAIEWLEDYLKTYPGGLLLVSHDRQFLANVSDKTFWLNRGRIAVNGRGYADFERWSEMIVEQEEARLQKMGKKLGEEEHWRERGVTARRKRNVKRMSELRALRERIRRERSAHARATGSVKLPALTSEQVSKLVVEMEGIGKSFGSNTVIRSFTTRILRGEKIGIIGKNGSGKTTFLKILTGAMEPDQGHLRRGVNLEFGYFDQNRASLNPNKTLWETLCPHGSQVTVQGRAQHVVGYLKQFLFTPEQAQSPVGTLSGGEANRLMLARLMTRPGNVLVLDEPTNDLDMDTLDMLEDLLAEYQGTVILVSHDRDFLDRLVQRTIAFEGDGVVEEYAGGYQDYLSQRKPPPVVIEKLEVKREMPNPAVEVTPVNPGKPSKLSYKHKYALETLPEVIEQLTGEIDELESQLADAELYLNAPERFHSLTALLQEKKAALLKAEEDWLEAEMAREKLG